MAIVSQLTFDVVAAAETARENNFFSAKLTDKVWVSLTLAAGGNRIALAPAASDIAVDFGGIVNGKLVVLKSEKQFTVKINGIGNPAITLDPATAVDNTIVPALMLLLSDAITSLHLGNPDGTNAIEVDAGIAGV